MVNLCWRLQWLAVANSFLALTADSSAFSKSDTQVHLMTPYVSIIMPTFNTAAYVERAIASVLNQTLQNFEIIVVDDASTDGTLDRVRVIADERIRVFVNSQNSGASVARNRAIAQAKGQWVALLDSDDWYAPQRLEKLLELAESHQADMVSDDLSFVRAGDTGIWSTLVQESGCVVNHALTVDSVYFVETDRFAQQCLHLGYTKPIFRRDFLTEQGIHYDKHNISTHDYWLYLSCLVADARFVFTPESYYFQFLRPGSLMSSSQIQRLDVDIRTSEEFLSLAAVKQNPELTSALHAGMKLYRRYREYYYVAEPLKARNWPLALINMARHPLFFWMFAQRLPHSIRLRLERYRFGQPLAAEKA